MASTRSTSSSRSTSPTTTTTSSTTIQSIPDNHFTYSPLDAENKEEFRILELLPGDPTDGIKCRLVKTTRDNSQLDYERLSYEALSYAWEDTTPTKLITVNDSPFKVTVTLEAALRCLRLGSKEDGWVRRLWIDAMCINQLSIWERNHQVQQMQEIYAGSDHVNVWLGAARDQSNLAIDFIEELCDHFNKLGVYSSNSTRIRRYEAQDFRPGLEPFLSPSFEHHWTALTLLFQRPWWGRAWVVQEVASAVTADVLCGERSVPWQLVALVSQLLDCCHFDLIRSFEVFRKFYRKNVIKLATNVVEVRERFRAGGHFPCLNFLLVYNRHRFCQDPRDKIFSILGLTDKGLRKSLSPDYSLPVAQVFAMAVKTDIRQHVSLWILHEVDRLKLSTIYPSWVPDFDEDIHMSRFQQAKDPFIADKGMGHDSDLALFSFDLQIMYVNGFSVSVVGDDNVQRSRSSCEWDEPTNNWKWDIDAMVERLFTGGGIHSLNHVLADAPTETKHRRVKAALYQVMMLGHIRTSAGIQKMTDDDYEEVIQRAQDPAVRGRGGFRGKTQSRTVFRSTDGHLGMASKLTQVGDKIFILRGLDTPAILRPNDDGSYLFISTSYVYGIMQGEAVEEMKRGVYTTEQITLR